MLERANQNLLQDPRWSNPGATPYEILGIDVGASAQAIRTAYRQLTSACHPGHFSDTPHLRKQAEFVTKRINGAYQALGQRAGERSRLTDGVRRLRTRQDRLAEQSADKQLGVAIATVIVALVSIFLAFAIVFTFD